MLALNQVTVKCTNVDYSAKHNMSGSGKSSNNVGHKIYKDVTCLTMNDIIVFLAPNDKSKYTFMNENVSFVLFVGGFLKFLKNPILYTFSVSNYY